MAVSELKQYIYFAIAMIAILICRVEKYKATPHVEIEIISAPKVCQQRTEAGDLLSMHYIGTLQSNGAKFDSSYDRKVPLEFRLGEGRVIQGWEIGCQNMCVGEKRRLIVPPELGYGNRDLGKIPPNSTLVFEIELVEIKQPSF